MARKTKTQRLQQVIGEYQRRNPGPFTTGEVADWAMSVGLVPTPGRLSSEQTEAGIWDRLFEQISNEKLDESAKTE